jgi:two-component system, LuxR family, response regulator FixJ
MSMDRSPAGARLVAIVDDDASVRRSMGRLVRSLGYRAETFGTAGEFFDSGLADAAGCLILDVRMPGMDGLALQRRLAEDGRAIPIVFITARASEDEERQALHGGAIAFLRKPVDKDSLVQAIATCWRRP